MKNIFSCGLPGPVTIRTVGMTSSLRIAFLGAGIMGAPMARNLLKAGFPLTIWNRSGSKAEALVADGAELAPSAQEATKDAEVVVTMLTDGAAVGELLFERGAAAGMKPGTLFIDMSSISPTEAKAHAARLAAQGVRCLDAPVSGGSQGAARGELTIMAGGKTEDFSSAKPVFAALGRATHVGPTGTGQLCKLANQVIVGVTIGAVSEAFLLAEAGGADRGKVREALQGGFASSRILDEHGLRMVKQNYEPGGPAKYQTKDLNNALAEAEGAGLDLPVTRLLRELFSAMTSGPLGEKDHSALLLYLEKRNGDEG